MRIYKRFFVIALCVMNIISFSSCDDLGFGENKHPSANYFPNDDGSNGASNDSVALADTGSVVPSIVQQTKIVQDKQNEQDSIIVALKDKIASLESKNSRMIESSTVFALIFLVLLVLFLLFGYLIRKMNNQKVTKNKQQYEDSSIDNGASQGFVRLLIKQNVEDLTRLLNSKYKAHEDAILGLERRLRKLEPKTDSYYSYSSSAKPEASRPAPKVSQDIPVLPQNTLVASVFYMPRTMVQLQFEDSKKKYSRSETTYFKFVLKSENVAIFTFEPYDDNCFKKAFDDRDNTLATVCDIEISNSQPRSCNNIEPGKAELRNGIWEVTKKLKLQYV